jgi:iron complex transport system substrate-binding protein
VNPAQSRYGDQRSALEVRSPDHGRALFLREKGKAPVRTSQDQAPSATAARGFAVARWLAIACAALVLLGGCAAPRPPRDATATPEEGWPRQLADDEGTTVTLAERPERIVSLTPATTELVFALDAGDRLVGRGDYDDYPAAALDLPGVATFTGVEHEALVGLEPDLVLAGGNNFTAAADVTRMRELGIPVLVLYAATFDGVIADIELVGRAIGSEAEAFAVISVMQTRRDGVAAAVAGRSRPRVFYQIGSEPEIYGPAPGSFVADMVSLAGGEPITTTDPAVFAIPVERLVAEDPQIIVLGDAQYGVCPLAVAARPGWGTMTAVRDGAIRPVYDTIVTRPGPRLAEGLAALALAIHPAAAIAPPTDLPALCVEQSP